MEQNTSLAIEIDEIQIIDAPEIMYDISVEDDHTYWISKTKNDWFLTHNTSWPDIDSDAGDRDVLINAARELFGDDAVIPVSNFNTLKLKSLVQDVSKFYGVTHDEVLNVTSGLQEEVMAVAKDENTEKSVFVLTHEDCLKHSKKYKEFMDSHPDISKHIEVLFMQNKSLGRHAGGVIIAPAESLEQNMPLINVRGELQTPWTEGMNFRNLEDNGMIKFDFLGLTLLEDVRNCIKMILIDEGNRAPDFGDVKEFFDKHLDCRKNDPSDQHVFKTAYHGNGWAPGLFQFTADGARQFCADSKPISIDELAAITAIYRPGPLKANVHLKYVEARAQIESGRMKYAHPIIEDVLSKTRGFVVYQEAFMILAQRLGGFSPAESDKLRKTLVKKSLDTLGAKDDERAQAKRKFIDGAKKLHDLPETVTGPLWQTIENMSVYCFNKSHSVAYAIDSYYAAWLYTYYPKQWLATVLQSETGNPDGLTKAIVEIKRLGYTFANSDVNYSGETWKFSEELGAFVPPLSALKKVGNSAMNEIVATRPFKNLHELLFDANGDFYHSKMNKSAFEALCMVEAFGSLAEMKTGKVKNHKQLFEILLTNYDTLKKGVKGMTPTAVKKLQKTGVAVPDIVDVLIQKTSDIEDWTRAEKIAMKQNISSQVDNDLLFPEGLVDKLKKQNVIPATELRGGEEKIVWFLVKEVTKKVTKTGKPFLVIKGQDHENRTTNIKVWGKGEIDIVLYTIWIAEAKGDDKWGPSTSQFKMKPILENL